MQTIAQMLEARGRERGLRESWEEGRREGFQEGWSGLLLRMLRRRFGELPASVGERVTAAGMAELESWADRLLDAGSLDEIFGEP